VGTSHTIGLAPRQARRSDAPELVRLRALMFESMGLDTSARAWRRNCEEHFAERLEGSRLLAAVVDAPQGPSLAASGVAELLPRLPSPRWSAGQYAYLSSFCTDPRWRHRGFAKAVLAFLLSELRQRGIGVAELHATADGEHLYTSFGFVERTSGRELRLDLGP
jgi:GNAT superfamily N-acetyltransferase